MKTARTRFALLQANALVHRLTSARAAAAAAALKKANRLECRAFFFSSI